jgi:hypothetical protein
MRANMRDSRRMNSAETVNTPADKTTIIMMCSSHPNRVSEANVEQDWYVAHRAGTPIIRSFIVLTAQGALCRLELVQFSRQPTLIGEEGSQSATRQDYRNSR